MTEVFRTFDIVDQLAEKYKRDDMLSVKRNGRWEKFSSSKYKEYVDNFSYGLLALGFKKGDKILTISNNRPEWNMIDMGMTQIGLVHVPVYANLGPIEYEHILSHSNARIIIVSSKKFYDNISPIAKKISNIEKIYTIDHLKRIPNWMEIIEEGIKNKNPEQLSEIKADINPDDMMSIIYTSGTTGRSKGVMLSHRNFISNVLATKDTLPAGIEDMFLSFLPLCHVFERMVNYLLQYRGIPIYYAESNETIGDNLREISPHGFTSVPRVIEKVYDKLIAKGKELKGIKKALFFWALKLALKFELNNANGWWYEFQRKIADKLIYTKWRDAVGGKIKIIILGGAALQPRLARVFNAAGMTMTEGYGLTETSPVIAVNHPEYPYMKFGTVGPVLKNVEVKIADDGEILMKGPSLMLGYYQDEEKTNKAIDKDGWFHTGDIGELHEHNILKITDRKKEIFKLSTGKYVAPQLIENRFKESNFIEQILVVGESEKYAAAIIVPAFEFLHEWCKIHKIRFNNDEDLVKIPDVISRFQKEVNKLNKTLGQHRQIKTFELISHEWTPESGDLSPTFKVKRKYLRKKYLNIFDRLYGYTDKSGYVDIL